MAIMTQKTFVEILISFRKSDDHFALQEGRSLRYAVLQILLNKFSVLEHRNLRSYLMQQIFADWKGNDFGLIPASPVENASPRVNNQGVAISGSLPAVYSVVFSGLCRG